MRKLFYLFPVGQGIVWKIDGIRMNSVANCTGFEHKLPLRSNLRYPLNANLQTCTKQEIMVFKKSRFNCFIIGDDFGNKDIPVDVNRINDIPCSS
jgi:hypothetical protein